MKSGDFYRELGDIFSVKLSPLNRWGGFKALRERWRAHVTFLSATRGPGGHRVRGCAVGRCDKAPGGRVWIADARFLTAKRGMQVMMPRKRPDLTWQAGREPSRSADGQAAGQEPRRLPSIRGRVGRHRVPLLVSHPDEGALGRAKQE